MVPAREVGGDFYDYIVLDEHHIGIAIADVSGKGVPAAFFMAIARTLLRATALFNLTPGACLARLNDLLAAENEQGMFVTVFYGILNTETGYFSYANGGHNHPALVKAGGGVSWLPGTGGMLIGMMEDIAYKEGRVRLDPGDMLFFYTDGVVEAFDIDGTEFTDRRLQDILEACGSQPPGEVAETVLATVKAFERGAPQADDITCVSIRYRSREAGPPAADGAFSITLRNRISDLDAMVDALKAFCGSRGIPAKVAGQLELALHELATNIVSYAWDDDQPHHLTIQGTVADGKVVIEIADDGRPFDPLAREDPDVDAPLEEREIGGLGIYYVKKLIDSVEYRRDGAFNRLILTKTVS